jgi:exopolysaccharide biosynthesis polyprenyl glycosylphosphotransferase
LGKFRHQLVLHSLQWLDQGFLVLALVVANSPILLREGMRSFAAFLSMRIELRNFIALVVLLWLWRFVFSQFALYDSKRLASRKVEVMDVTKAMLICTAILALFGWVLQMQMVTPPFVLIFWLSGTFLIASTRVALRTWLRRYRAHGRNVRNLLIVGSNSRAIEFAGIIPHRPEWGYHIIGFADEEWEGVKELEGAGFRLVTDFAGLPMFLRRNVIDEVIIALPVRSFHEHATRIADLCEQQGIVVRMPSDLFSRKVTQPRVEDFDDAALITHYAGPVQGWPVLTKRVLDVIVSLALLWLLAPLLLLTAILIKLTSHGPVLFVQKRVGLNKRVFHIFKFRTMVMDAESKLAQLERLNEVSGPVFKMKRDPRVTALGRILRKTSIDELPQLLNVLKGDMSLVGPRPLQLRDYELFTLESPDWQRCRFSVRPGITCLWQVNGRSSLPFEKWMELDLQYVRKWSLWMDLKILVKTIPAVLKGSGAA